MKWKKSGITCPMMNSLQIQMDIRVSITVSINQKENMMQNMFETFNIQSFFIGILYVVLISQGYSAKDPIIKFGIIECDLTNVFKYSKK